MRILIAEDDPVSRRLLQAVLVKWGYDVVVTSDGNEAWEVLQAPDAPRLAILDWMMPGMDGVQVCKAVRDKGDEQYTYVLLLTARSQKQDLIEGMHSGADDYVTKPFDTNELEVRLCAGKRVLDLQAELLSVREALRREATRDPLTGLPNRLLFGDRLTHNLCHAKRRDEQLAVMFLDLDSFKLINDTLGHSIGDDLLKMVAERLTTALRDVDTIARMGGDEFTVIMTGLSGVEDAASIARRALQAFSTPFQLGSHELYVTPSIGISLFPSDGLDAETLVRNADAAMYRAKEEGRNNYQIYTEALNAAAVERVTLERNLRRALERNEFVLYYQPRLSIKTRQVLGVEALVRWRHPELGLIPPAQFIPLAEDTGLIVPISEWVLQTACRQNKAWQDAGLLSVDVAVNISPRQFHQDDLRSTVESALFTSGLESQYLGLELTETTLMQNPETAAEILRELKDMGVKLAIDDFGTGYSSLSHLKKFPIDSVKIDQSFVREITISPDDAAIAGAVVAMAHSMNLRVTAEGVETLEQLEFLKSLNCDEMQGYFIGRPMPAEDVEVLLRGDSGSVGKAA